MGDFDMTQLQQDMCTVKQSSYFNWGTLVKTWVTGVNQFNDNKNYSIPATKDTLQLLGAVTKDQFQRLLTSANVNMTIPDSVTEFVFVQDDDSTVIVRLPAKKVVEDVQSQLEGLARTGGDGMPLAHYPLPKFYADLWPNIPDPTTLDRQGLLKMQCMRMGEYTINTCG